MRKEALDRLRSSRAKMGKISELQLVVRTPVNLVRLYIKLASNLIHQNRHTLSTLLSTLFFKGLIFGISAAVILLGFLLARCLCSTCSRHNSSGCAGPVHFR
jgi:tetrahydromethanopterin S-methyltransferase subunit F